LEVLDFHGIVALKNRKKKIEKEKYEN